MSKSGSDYDLSALTDALRREFEHWDHLYTHGGSDPFWADGMGLNLTRNHIISIKRQIDALVKDEQENSLFGTSYPDIYNRSTPDEVPYDYMAKADDIRTRAMEQLALYEQDPNFCYIRDHYEEAFPQGETRATREAGLIAGSYAGYHWYRKYIEGNDLVAMRTRFGQPYEDKAEKWATLADKLRRYLSSEHVSGDNSFVSDDLSEENIESEEEVCETSHSKPSLAKIIESAESRSDSANKQVKMKEEQLSLF